MSGYPIPRDALLADRLGFIGTAGSGKTYNAGSAIERALQGGARAVIVDPLGVWWGLRLDAGGDAASRFKVVIFGGPHGDLPLSEHAGALIGETVAGTAESCILDLSELGTKAAERRFMLAFLTALYRHASREPLHLVFDEADMWAPQQLRDKDGEAAKLLGMMETVVRRGRIRGFVPWLITQRPAVLNKDVLSQIDGLVAFKLTSSQDRSAIGDWVQGQADKAQWNEIWASLPTLQRGHGVVWLPARGVLVTAQFPLKATFDSSKTPERGEKRARLELKPLDVEKLKGKLAKVVEEVKANDPKALKSQVAALKRELEAERKKTPAALPVDAKDVRERIAKAREDGYRRGYAKGFDDCGIDMTGIRGSVDRMLRGLAALRDLATEVEAAQVAIAEVQAKRREAVKDIAVPVAIHAPAAKPVVKPPTAFDHAPAPRAAASRRTNGADSTAGDITIGRGERICLIAIAQHADGVTREQLTVLTGYKRSSRNTYLQRLSSAGLIDNGDRLVATDAGIAALGDAYEPLPTGDALRQHVLATLPEGERNCLLRIIASYPSPVDPETLGEATGYLRSSRNTYLQRLASRELIVRTADGPRASPNLFD